MIHEVAVDIKQKYRKENSTVMSADAIFSLIGVMLMSEKVKVWAPNIFPHIVKAMDCHYTAGSIASDVQRF